RAPGPACGNHAILEIERQAVGLGGGLQYDLQAVLALPSPDGVADDVDERELVLARVPYGPLAEDDVPGDDVERRIPADDALPFRSQHVDFDFQVIQRSVHFLLRSGLPGENDCG